jgi:transposase
LKSNCGRQRVNINGAVDVTTLETVTDFTESVNAQSTSRLFGKVEAKHPSAKEIHVILDNARYYRSKILEERLETARIKLHFLTGTQ